MTDEDPESDDSTDDESIMNAMSSFISMRKAFALVRAGMKGLDAAFDVIRYALEANEEATIEVLKNHEDPIDTLTSLAKIIRGDDFPTDEDGDVDVGD